LQDFFCVLQFLWQLIPVGAASPEQEFVLRHALITTLTSVDLKGFLETPTPE